MSKQTIQINGAREAAVAASDGELSDNQDGLAFMDLSLVSPSRRPMGRERLRRLSREEPYVHSVNQVPYAMTRLRGRRQSDPGRISVSPIRMRSRNNEDEIYEDDESEAQGACHPRLLALRSVSMTVPEEFADEGLRGTSPQHRSRPRERISRRTMRSNSLPTSDPAIFEIGEAIGAVAISRPPAIAENMPADPFRLSPTGALNRRRRSVSIESTNLEAIHEDNDQGEMGSVLTIEKASRRLSTPALNT